MNPTPNPTMPDQTPDETPDQTPVGERAADATVAGQPASNERAAGPTSPGPETNPSPENSPASEIHPSRESTRDSWLRRIGIGLTATVAMLVAAFGSLPMLLIPGLPVPNSGVTPATAATMTIAGILNSLVALGLVWLLTKLWRRDSVAGAGFRFPARGLAYGLLATVIGIAVTMAGRMLAVPLGVGEQVTPDPGQVMPALVPLIIWTLSRALLLQGFPEELLLRGFLMRQLSLGGLRPVPTIAVSSVFFMVPHLLSSGGQVTVADHLAYLLPPLGFAVLGGALACLWRSLWPAVGIHTGFHLASPLTELLPVVRTGAATDVVLGLFYLLVSIPVLVAVARRKDAVVEL
ncbi:type II CAAX endopeptidase family protein [Parenemella sanctibonifatiensis]|uniref:CAAX prenyl protease 2/Lysostaphin resistance protein A-like domain-containing protein n=1 Tax=Parenemella sanctibonifatiensis TaxID=2016505 RepID=A0A255EG24_9ACTN|nr:type II CAAX endopeptidase family protein [Parenemella sanctibonifatiensis]OYN90478.1 hypothetical protein CGZ92_01200 [Parenemella sanctibonifatiensis]